MGEVFQRLLKKLRINLYDGPNSLNADQWKEIMERNNWAYKPVPSVFPFRECTNPFGRRLCATSPAPASPPQPQTSYLLPLLAVAALLLCVCWVLIRRFRSGSGRGRRSSLAQPDRLRLLEEGRYRQASKLEL